MEGIHHTKKLQYNNDTNTQVTPLGRLKKYTTTTILGLASLLSTSGSVSGQSQNDMAAANFTYQVGVEESGCVEHIMRVGASLPVRLSDGIDRYVQLRGGIASRYTQAQEFHDIESGQNVPAQSAYYSGAFLSAGLSKQIGVGSIKNLYVDGELGIIGEGFYARPSPQLESGITAYGFGELEAGVLFPWGKVGLAGSVSNAGGSITPYAGLAVSLNELIVNEVSGGVTYIFDKERVDENNGNRILAYVSVQLAKLDMRYVNGLFGSSIDYISPYYCRIVTFQPGVELGRTVAENDKLDWDIYGRVLGLSPSEVNVERNLGTLGIGTRLSLILSEDSQLQIGKVSTNPIGTSIHFESGVTDMLYGGWYVGGGLTFKVE